MSKQVKYRDLRTMEELKRARRKLRIMQNVNESYLREDLEELKYRLSPSVIFGQAKDKLIHSGSLFTKIFTGIRMFVALRNRSRR